METVIIVLIVIAVIVLLAKLGAFELLGYILVELFDGMVD